MTSLDVAGGRANDLRLGARACKSTRTFMLPISPSGTQPALVASISY
ncbi:MAG: hypothetical protein JSS93_04540 [Bacteroidetes bacterium]|nr:hypothetical protein [Bacteroidota bacterium]